MHFAVWSLFDDFTNLMYYTSSQGNLYTEEYG